MAYLSPSETFKSYTQALIIGVYSDKITASVVRKDNTKAIIVASSFEAVESAGMHDGIIPTEKIIFNMEKAIMALPHDVRTPAMPVIIILGPGAGVFSYMTVQGKRDAKARKITAEEIQMMIAAANTEKGNFIFNNYPEYFSIDGFSVSNPVGVNGEELSAGVVHVSCDAHFEQVCAERLTAFGFRYTGMIDMRYAASREISFFKKSPHALLVFIFEHETYGVLMREKTIHAVGAAHTGYGILYRGVAQTFSVGYEEAKAIVRAYRKGELDDSAKATVASIFTAGSQKIISITEEMIARIDLANIIPGNVWVICADRFPEIIAHFTLGDWLAHLPIERNAGVQIFSEENASDAPASFDRATIDFLIGHH